MDRRCRINEQVLNVIQAHGVAGLFINPESTLVAEGSTASHSFPQKRNTALHHTRLSDSEFATIATSLAEGVGIRTTGRIQQVDKKTVLLILKKAGVAAIRTTGHPSLILAAGIAIGVVTLARALSKNKGDGHDTVNN